ncbi:PD40 domain-containing protein [Leptothermofonsia sichuanensis E412]|uniref:NACHT and WD repeat domain-containing protein n=1 Tax=Leptothermofonsia sichuanensis TaxID=2917832 RepID=UPI001CA6192A|nr:WD40 repeat domain-containing protein [Leptothermofonsia sichuanensis]QZZ21236.1 PD40 domain-containing protein [Leptothermofonsia sichuanensis E412]
MTDSHSLEEHSHNERSLKRLARSIELSAGRFSLNLVRCNYLRLQAEMQQLLCDRCSLSIQHLVLKDADCQLYRAGRNLLEFRHHLEQELPQALMISGFESVIALDELLVSTNQVRDDFKKYFPFPLVLWVNDEVLKKLMRLAPDFYSWASVPIDFTISTAGLIELLQQETDARFTEALEIGAGRFPRSSAHYPGSKSSSHWQLRTALKELGDRSEDPNPALKASLDFVLGQDAYASNQMDLAYQHYEQSRVFWQTELDQFQAAEAGTAAGMQAGQRRARSSRSITPALCVERLGCVLFYLGLWWRRKSVLSRASFDTACDQAQAHYQQCIDVWRRGKRLDLCAKFINALGEVLQRKLLQKGLSTTERLAIAKQLEIVARSAIKLHISHPDTIRLAYSYGLLAEVALAKQHFHQASVLAEKALQTNTLPADLSPESQRQYAERGWAQRHYQSLYRLLLAQAQSQVTSSQTAIQILEVAKGECNHAYDPLLYTRILETLRDLYFKQGEYLAAFKAKQEQRSIEQQYRLRAFIGAVRVQPERQVMNPGLVPVESPDGTEAGHSLSERWLEPRGKVAEEIVASGRERDIENLIRRLSENRYPLTIIHGPSGVGKSSILSAGLVPALQENPSGDRRVLPILHRVYGTDWVKDLSKCMAAALSEQGLREEAAKLDGVTAIQPLIEQLRENTDRLSLLTVLIFDQLEEFFFTHPKPGDRQPFYQFLRECLSLSFVKVVLALREDFLFYLLELSQLDLGELTDDILSRDKRYPLGNFTPANARLIIERLVQRSQFHLDPDLIEQVVKDLSTELGTVRPIELQIVGAQLQDSNITSLQAYQSLGRLPKGKLVEQFLEQVVKDCGHDNEHTATSVLFLLTDEKGVRPLKTLPELIVNLKELGLPANETQLQLILDILVGSGLVLDIPEIPIERYQLAHDYLTALVQSKGKPVVDHLIDILKSNRLIQASRKRNRKVLLGLAVGLGVPLVGFAFLAFNALIQVAIADTRASITRSTSQLRANEQLEALASSVETGIQLNHQGLLGPWIPDLIKAMALGNLLETTYSVRERDRLVGHRAHVNSVSYNSKTRLIASASDDNSVILWNLNGRLVKRLEGHTNRVNSVSIHPSGLQLASASDDGTVRLWTLTDWTATDWSSTNSSATDRAPRVLGRVLEVSGSWVSSVAYSPDGKILASASDDGIIKLWNTQTGQVLNTWKGHGNRVRSLSFAPKGEQLASASWDGTVRLWSRDGTELKRVGKEGDPKVTSVRFSPDGQFIATGSWDNRVKVWRVADDSDQPQVFTGHTDRVTGIDFSPDGKTLISTSDDGTVRLWDLQNGAEIQVLKIPNVTSVIFLDHETLATGGGDRLVRFWKLNGVPATTFQEETPISSFSFSPDGRWIASTSRKMVSVVGELGSSGEADLEHCSLNSGKASITGESITHREEISGHIKLRHLDGHQKRVFAATGDFERVKFSPSGQVLVSLETFSTSDAIFPNGSILAGFEPSSKPDPIASRIRLWDLNGKELKHHPLQGRAADISFSPDGKTIAIANNKCAAMRGNIHLWDIEHDTFKSISAHNDRITSISYSRDGMLASGSEDSTIKLWTRAGKPLRQLKGHTNMINSLSFSPDGKTLASASADGTVKLWTLEGRDLITFTGHPGAVMSVNFSPNGRLVITGGEDGTIKIWHVSSGELLATLRGNANWLSSIGFSPNGKLIAAASNDHTISLWQFELNYLLKQGCSWIENYLRTNQNLKDNTLCTPS